MSIFSRHCSVTTCGESRLRLSDKPGKCVSNIPRSLLHDINMKISTFAKLCTCLEALEYVSQCDVFMTKDNLNIIIVSFCLNRDLCGSISIREREEVEVYEVVVDRKQLSILCIESGESDSYIPDKIVNLLEDYRRFSN
jgi:hypothetical protein